MLELLGKTDHSPTHCDGYSRRNFLKVGGMAAGGLPLSQLLALEAKAKIGSSHEAIINIYLPGGSSHLDMFDLKPGSPSEIRGEFRAIRTNVGGMEICELFPKLAKIADKFAIVRSLSNSDGGHRIFLVPGFPATFTGKILVPKELLVSLHFFPDNPDSWTRKKSATGCATRVPLPMPQARQSRN